MKSTISSQLHAILHSLWDCLVSTLGPEDQEMQSSYYWPRPVVLSTFRVYWNHQRTPEIAGLHSQRL